MNGGHRVCRTSELPVGASRIVEIDGRSIGVFHLPTGFYALLNRCPHRGAPLCEGRVTGLVTAPRPQEWELEREGEIVRCPWHGWEFDIATGRSVFNPHRVRTRTYPVTTEPGESGGEGIDAEGVASFVTTVQDDWVIVHLNRAAPALAGAGSARAVSPSSTGAE